MGFIFGWWIAASRFGLPICLRFRGMRIWRWRSIWGVSGCCLLWSKSAFFCLCCPCPSAFLVSIWPTIWAWASPQCRPTATRSFSTCLANFLRILPSHFLIYVQIAFYGEESFYVIIQFSLCSRAQWAALWFTSDGLDFQTPFCPSSNALAHMLRCPTAGKVHGLASAACYPLCCGGFAYKRDLLGWKS